MSMPLLFDSRGRALASDARRAGACLALLSIGACGGAAGHDVMALTCQQGSIRPLAETPEQQWPSTIQQGLAAMQEVWSGPFSVTVRCPDLPDARARIQVTAPEKPAMSKYDPPASTPEGSIFECLDAAGGEG